MKVLFIILTCNRLHYLRNCLNSIMEFVDLDRCQLMIADNNTIEEGADEFFSSLPSDVIVKRFTDRVPNELYRAMNFGIKHCRKNKIPYINFIQDDYQYLYKVPYLVDKIIACFEKHEKIGQINTNMIWKRKNPGKIEVIKVRGMKFAILKEKRLVDNGFTRVSLYDKAGLYPTDVISYDQDSSKTHGFGKDRYKKFTNGEIWFGRHGRRLGYLRAITLMPNSAMMYDCSYIRGLQRFGDYFPPPNKYYLSPFEPEDVDIVKRKHNKGKFCLIEEMAKPSGWKPTTFDKHNKGRIRKENLVQSI